jgi:hypothetical protein
LKNDPKIEECDLFRIQVVRGYDLGFAHAERSWRFAHTPSEWRELLFGEGQKDETK